MDYRLRFLTGSVSPEAFERYRADIEEMDHNIYAWIDLDRDFYHRYYRDIPRMMRGAAVILAIALGGGIWWVMRRHKPSRT